MTKLLYEYELTVDLAKSEGDYRYKEKEYIEHIYLAETKDQIAYINNRFCGEQISTIEKDDSKKKKKSYDKGNKRKINKIYCHSFYCAGFKQESANLITDTPKDIKKIYTKLQNELKKYVNGKNSPFELSNQKLLDFSEIEIEERRINENEETEAGEE